MLLEDALSTVEHQLQDVRAALLAADALSLERCATLLRQAAMTFSQSIEPARPGRAAPLAPAQAQRVQAVSTELSMLREQLARLLVIAERQAATFLPPKDASTYGNGAAPTGGAGSRARIYRSNS